MFFDDELVAHIVHETNLYSVQKTGSSVNTSASEIEQYIGILHTMGIYKLPQYWMFWVNDTRIPQVADTMSIYRFSL